VTSIECKIIIELNAIKYNLLRQGGIIWVGHKLTPELVQGLLSAMERFKHRSDVSNETV